MGQQSLGRWSVLVTLALVVQHARGSGKLDILFSTYNGNGKESSGQCCDVPWPFTNCGDDPCDPYFLICVESEPTSQICDLYLAQSEIFDNQNSIAFGNSIGSTIVNPIVISLATVPMNFALKVGITDHDRFNEDDHIDDLARSLTLQPTVNGNKGDYMDVVLLNSALAILTTRIRSYCDLYYFGSSCTVRCKDYEYGQYTCNKQTGEKICDNGWEGANCHIDINECTQNPCQNGGTCINFGGGFSCNCREGFKGDLCEETEHECVIDPCLNGGTCHGNETHFSCDCLPWWSGVTCEAEVDPCDSQPCQNNATCIFSNATTTGFTCNCASDWTGYVCEVEITTTTTATTTTSLQTLPPPAAVTYGDPYYVTLLGIIDDTNRQDLINGLGNLISELGVVEVEVYVKVKTEIIPINPSVTTTNVEFISGTEVSPIDERTVDHIFTSQSDNIINFYLPLPLYRPENIPETQEVNWIQSNWYAIVIPALFGLILLAYLATFLVRNRRGKTDTVKKERSMHASETPKMAFDNVTYQQPHRQRHSVIMDREVTPNEIQLNGKLDGVFSNDSNPTRNPYDSVLMQKLPSPYETKQYPKPKLAALDARLLVSSNDYTNFHDLDRTRRWEDDPYEEIDDVIAQKLALSVGVPADLADNVSIDYPIDDVDTHQTDENTYDDRSRP